MKTRISKYYDIARRIYSEEGVAVVGKRAVKKVSYTILSKGRKERIPVKDILFINGCDIKYCERYRVDHPMEELEFNGISSDKIFYTKLSKEMVKNYRGFIFYRCPITPEIEEFIKAAKELNKKCFFSVDDLVIDTKFTDQIEEVQKMSKEDRKLYDDGVNRMKKTMELCEFGIATTEVMSEKMSSYGLKGIYINRNVMSEKMVQISLEALKNKAEKEDEDRIVIGYFSGSITHNADFQMVLPSLVKILKKYKNVSLKIAGVLNVPKELEDFEDQIIRMEFKKNWQELPVEIAECDIILAPIQDTIFNQAKSEIKWTEAALVKVPVVASDLGAFEHIVKNKETGILVKNDEKSWFEGLEFLIKNKDERRKIGANAQAFVLKNCITASESGTKLAQFIKSKLAKNVAFVLPTMNISGGIIVAMKHAEILQNNGFDVSIINRGSVKKMDFGEIKKFSLYSPKTHKLEVYFDEMVSTLWDTVYYTRSYKNKGRVNYFVQNYETDFYAYGEPLRKRANSTYSMNDVRYFTMSRWCQNWLEDVFSKKSDYVANGIENSRFKVVERDFKGKIRILIEGDSESEYKKVDESFRIVNELGADNFVVSYLSYNGKPKDWYKVDKFYNRVPSEKVGEIYQDNDILIKSSILESFSYPPLEMMATGGIAVIAPNDGNAEYAKDKINCIEYKPEDIKDAAQKIREVLDDKKYRDKIISGGLKTAEEFSWENREKDVINIYK